MQPDQMAIGIYNHIRRAGGGYRTSARGEIGGIPLAATRYNYAGKRNFSLIRPGSKYWVLRFVVIGSVYDDDTAQMLWIRQPPKVVKHALPGEDYVRGKARVYAYEGDYEGWKHDAALLCMFESEWGE